AGRNRRSDLRAERIATKEHAGISDSGAFRVRGDRRHGLDGGGKFDGQGNEFDLPHGKASGFLGRTLRPDRTGTCKVGKSHPVASARGIRAEGFRGKVYLLRRLARIFHIRSAGLRLVGAYGSERSRAATSRRMSSSVF